MKTIKVGFEKIQGTARCAQCNNFVKKQNMVQFPKMLLPMLNDSFEMGLCPKCAEKKSVAELQELLETKFQREMPTLKVQAVKAGRRHWSKYQDGISNKQMIPMIKDAMKAGEYEIIRELNRTYPDIFESSLKYIGQKRRDKLPSILEQPELQQAM